MKRMILLGATVALGMLFAHDEPHGKAVSVTGMVVDTGCYLSHNSKGAEHVACATMCAKAGVPLAILDDKGKLFTVVAADHKNPNTKLMPFIEKRVKVDGTLIEKGGLTGIAIKTVEASE
jgi:3-dehydroquinate synthetase